MAHSSMRPSVSTVLGSGASHFWVHGPPSTEQAAGLTAGEHQRGVLTLTFSSRMSSAESVTGCSIASRARICKSNPIRSEL